MRIFTLLFFLFVMLTQALPRTTTARIFNSNMVLQRGVKVPIWGWSDSGKVIKITFNGKNYKAITDNAGKWIVYLKPLKDVGPFELKIESIDTVFTLRDILIGDVYLCSGQSNMEFPIDLLPIRDSALKTAIDSNIRMFTVPRCMEITPNKDLKPGGYWLKAVGKNIRFFSATAYFFAKYIHTETGIPIGIISTSHGESAIESWLSPDVFKKDSNYFPLIKIMEDKLISMKNIDSNYKNFFELWKRNSIFKGIGFSEKWYLPEIDTTGWKKTENPVSFKKLGKDIYYGGVWFRKNFDLPENFVDTGLVFNFGSTMQNMMIWINGNLIGESFSPYEVVKKHSFIVPKSILKKENNSICLYFFSWDYIGGYLGAPKDIFIESKNQSEQALTLSGNWIFKKGTEISYQQGKDYPDMFKLNYQNDFPSILYNGMLAPVIPYAIRGFAWYQGEQNQGMGYEYRDLLKNLIDDWRLKWGQGDLPFLVVQLAGYKNRSKDPNGWELFAEVRESQSEALKLKNTAIIVTDDIGDSNTVHPKNKKEVGRRLGIAAMKLVYGKNIEYSGPVYKSHSIEGNKIRILYDHIGSGLFTSDSSKIVKGFKIAGKDGRFYWANGELDGNTVIVFCDSVAEPVAVRYAWANYPDVNLYNKEGLPASPFRTDNWKNVTYNEKNLRFYRKRMLWIN